MAQTQEGRVLKMLHDAGSRGVTNFQFANARILRYGGYIHELRNEGHNILTERDRLPNGKVSNVWRYTLIDQPQPKKKREWLFSKKGGSNA